MYLPSVKRLECNRERPVRYSMIEQPAYDTGSSVRIALREAERVRRMVIIEGYLTGIVRVLFPTLQPLQTVLQRGVTDGFGIAFYILEMFFI